jgi:predicted dienelactone hydrolase
LRSLEALLLCADLLAFLALALPGLPRWATYVVPAAALVALAQVLIEGPRWEMAPAYVLTAVMVLVWLRSTVPAGRRASQMPTNRVATGVAIGLGVLGLALAIALPLILPVFRFPAPGGPYGIGTMTYHWVDPARPELFGDDPNAHRELMVQIWYPATLDPASPRAPYMAEADAVTVALAHIQRLPEVVFGHFKYVTTNAVSSAPVAADLASYPVLIYLEGATGFRQMGMFQVEELVSHGYIIAALDQPGAAAAVVFPDGHQVSVPPIEDLRAMIGSSYLRRDSTPLLNGRPLEGNSIVPYLAQDVSFALDQLTALNAADPNGLLTGHLNLRRVGAFGMSLGGIVAGEACLRDARLKACLVMDAPMTFDVVAAGLRQPSMWITRDAAWMRLERERSGGWPEDEIEAHLTSMRAVYESLSGPGYFVEVAGMFHSNFMDVPKWFPLASLFGLSGPIDGDRGHRIVNAYSLAFFDKHLKGEAAALLDGRSEQYPEVLFETRQP